MKEQEWSEAELIDRLRQALRQAEELSETVESLEYCVRVNELFPAIAWDTSRVVKALTRELAAREANVLRCHFNRYHERRWQQVVA